AGFLGKRDTPESLCYGRNVQSKLLRRRIARAIHRRARIIAARKEAVAVERQYLGVTTCTLDLTFLQLEPKHGVTVDWAGPSVLAEELVNVLPRGQSRI